jgi:REP element-mobilizing transposase RayT
MKLQETKYYHIHHRGVKGDNIFYHDSDYQRFLESYFYYLYIAADTYAYCLIPNHFHLLIRVRPEDEQLKLFTMCQKEMINSQELSPVHHNIDYPDFKKYSASNQLGHFLNSYTRYLNTINDQTGVIFDGRFKRVEIDSIKYLSHLICYIHRNPIHHHLCRDFSSYKYSSYNVLFSDEKTLLNQKEVLKVLGGEANAAEAHEEVRMEYIAKYILE